MGVKVRGAAVLRFRVFGGVQATRGDGWVIPLARRDQQLLACLLVREDHVATTDELVEDIWGQDLPAHPRNSLQVLVKRVRHSLGDTDHSLLVSVGDGYALAIDYRSSDVGVFRRLFRAARALCDAEPAVARTLFDRSLEFCAGELPEFDLASRASEDAWDLLRQRDKAERLAKQLVDHQDARSPNWTGRGDEVVMVLRLPALDDMSLASAVMAATNPLGAVRCLSGGIMIVEFREAGAAVRAAKRFVEAGTGEPWRLLGGAVGGPGSTARRWNESCKRRPLPFPDRSSCCRRSQRRRQRPLSKSSCPKPAETCGRSGSCGSRRAAPPKQATAPSWSGGVPISRPC